MAEAAATVTKVRVCPTFWVSPRAVVARWDAAQAAWQAAGLPLPDKGDAIWSSGSISGRPIFRPWGRIREEADGWVSPGRLHNGLGAESEALLRVRLRENVRQTRWMTSVAGHVKAGEAPMLKALLRAAWREERAYGSMAQSGGEFYTTISRIRISPGAMERRIRQIRSRVCDLRRAYGPQAPAVSWSLMARVLLGHTAGRGQEGARINSSRLNRLARIVWACALGSHAHTHRQAVAHMIATRVRGLVVDVQEGVATLRTPTPTLRKGCVIVFDTVTVEPANRRDGRGRLVAYRGERTTGSLHMAEGRQTFHSASRGAWALKEALRAWRAQELAGTEERDLRAILQGEGLAMPLVTMQDSLRAGHCRPGTEAFCRQYGLPVDRPVAPGVLVRIAGTDPRVQAVLRTAARRTLRELELRN